jgi:hypothetical protein
MRLKETMLADDYAPAVAAPMRFKFITDPGHGWLRVPHKVIRDMGLTAKSFSRYSYVDNDYMYLEEDCDAGVFLQAYQNITGSEADYVVEEVNYTNIRQKLRNAGGKDDFA